MIVRLFSAFALALSVALLTPSFAHAQPTGYAEPDLSTYLQCGVEKRVCYGSITSLDVINYIYVKRCSVWTTTQPIHCDVQYNEVAYGADPYALLDKAMAAEIEIFERTTPSAYSGQFQPVRYGDCTENGTVKSRTISCYIYTRQRSISSTGVATYQPEKRAGTIFTQYREQPDRCAGFVPNVGCPGPNADNTVAIAASFCPAQTESAPTVPPAFESPSCGNPIHLMTGAKTESRVDLSWPIAFSRGYASNRSEIYSLGAWRHNHDTRLIVTLNNHQTPYAAGLYFQMETGEGVSMVSAGPGEPWEATFKDQKGFVVEQNAEGFLLTLPSGERRQYSPAGFILWRKARSGYQLSYTHDAMGRMTQITDSYQRGLTLGYTGSSPLIRSVTVSGVPGAADTVVYGYAINKLTSAVFNGVESVSYGYNAAGKLASITNPLGKTYAQFAYDASGRATQSKHIAAGVATEVTDVAYGTNVVSVTQNGAVSSFTTVRDPNSFKTHVTSATLAGGQGSYQVTYESGTGRAKGLKTGAYTNSYRNSSTTGLPIERTRRDNQSVTYEWTASRQLESMSEPSAEGRRNSSYGYDADGNLTSVSVTSGSGETRSQSWTYGSFGKVLSATAVDGSTTSYAYYSDTDSDPGRRGQLESVTNALGQTIRFDAYDARGNPTLVVDANLAATTMSYNARGQMLSVSRLGVSETRAYDAAGQLKTIARSNGQTETLGYDDAGRLMSVSNNAGESAALSYDAHGNQHQSRIYKGPALEATVNRTFTALGQLKSAWASTAAEANSVEYDINGQVKTSTDGLGRASTYTYNGQGDALTYNDKGMSATLGRDKDGNLTRYAGGSVTATAYTWNDFQELLTVVGPDSGSSSASYDAQARASTFTDASGATRVSVVDELGRPVSTSYQGVGAATLNESFTYDAGPYGVGRLSSIADNASTQEWSWTEMGAPASKTQTVQGVALAIHYGYDAQGELISMQYPSGMIVGYERANGRVTGLTINGQPFMSNINYRASTGEPVSWSWAAGGSYLKTFDANGKISGVADSGVLAQTTAFDGAMRLTSLTDSAGGAFSLTPSYSTGDQLAGYSVNGGANATLAYNANWNRTVKTAPGAATETASFAYQTNLILSLATVGLPARAFAVDAKKNTINNGRGVFAYDLKNNLIQATVNGVVSTYAFDALNQRVSKTVGGVVKRFIYDEAGGLAGEYDGSGSAQVEHVYFGDLPVGVSVGGAIHRVHTDYLGTPRVVTQGSAIVWKWASTDPFGGNAPSVASVVYNPRFPGQYFDAETGLHHNKHRAYDSQLGRYLQPDPLGLAAGKNPFNYVNQNPLNGTDPKGLSPYGLTNGPHGAEWNFSISALNNPVRQVWEGGTRAAKKIRGPDYVAVSGNLYLYSVGGSVNLHNGNFYLQGGLTRSLPNHSYKPSICLVFGSIIDSEVEAVRVDKFLNGAATQTSAFFPMGNPYLGAGGGFSHSYGGDSSIEYGLGSVGAGVSPITYGKRKE